MFPSSQDYGSTMDRLCVYIQQQRVSMSASSSGTTLVCIAPPLSVLNSYSVVMDAAPGPDTSDNGLRLELLDRSCGNTNQRKF